MVAASHGLKAGWARWGAPRWILAGALLLMCGAAPGCGTSLAGDWDLVRAQPSRSVFAMEDVRFAKDGTYSAKVTLDGRVRNESGAYEFNGFKLKMRPQGGGMRTYNAMRKVGTLEINADGKSVVLKKAGK